MTGFLQRELIQVEQNNSETVNDLRETESIAYGSKNEPHETRRRRRRINTPVPPSEGLSCFEHYWQMGCLRTQV